MLALKVYAFMSRNYAEKNCANFKNGVEECKESFACGRRYGGI